MSSLGALLLATLLSPQDTLVHPLDPLSVREIALVRQVLSAAGKLTSGLRFSSLTLREPAKDAVLRELASGQFRRSAEAVLYDWSRHIPFRAHVDLTDARLIAWDSLPSREPPSRNLIRRRLDEVVRGDPRWQGVLERRGISDTSRVIVLPVLGESRPLPWLEGERVVEAVGYDLETIGRGGFLAGLRLVVNLTRGSLVRLSDSGGQAARAVLPSASPPAPRAAPAPQAGSISVRGSQVRWRNWRLHFGVHPRRGLELWDIAWMEAGRARPVLYRASVSELMAVYGDPDYSIWFPRDAGNAGLGDYQRNELLEADAPAEARFAEAVFADDRARPIREPRAVALYERDGGVLWRHAGTSRRARQLVLTSRATVDNYDFIFNWIFGEDGRIEVEVHLTGVMLLRRADSTAARSGAHGAAAHRVAPGIAAPNHQHFVSFRLDFDVGGAQPNRVVEQEAVRVPQGRANPDGLWFEMRERQLASERESRRNLHTAASRKWRVVNTAERNSLGEHPGYTLVPGEVAIPYSTPRSPARRAAGFVGHQLWVTPYRRDEMYAAGEFVNFGLLDQGLPTWTAANRSVLDTDVVLWYTLGTTHLARPEDYPVMPVHRVSFQLIPTGFFTSNPALAPRVP